jgi:hypothetical protein
MTKSDELELWRHIKLLHEAHYRLGISLEALQALSDQDGHHDQRVALEKSAFQAYSLMHEDTVGIIEQKIQHLMKDSI